MLLHRCPWCGEELIRPTKAKKCPFCQNPLVEYRKNNKGNARNRKKYSSAILYIIPFLWLPFNPPFEIIEWSNNFFLCTFLYSSCIFVLLGLLYIPFARDISKENKKIPSAKDKVAVTLSWEKRENSGLASPRLQVPNGEIFPACFLDANGQPLTTELCIVLEDIEWTDSRHGRCKTHLVLDSISSQEIFSKADTFYLYYNRRRIAQGSIQSHAEENPLQQKDIP